MNSTTIASKMILSECLSSCQTLGAQTRLKALAALPASKAFWLAGSAMEMTKELSKGDGWCPACPGSVWFDVSEECRWLSPGLLLKDVELAPASAKSAHNLCVIKFCSRSQEGAEEEMARERGERESTPATFTLVTLL